MTDAAATSLSILHVSQPVDHGVARCVAALVADQVSRGWRVAVACPSDGWLADEVRSSGAVHLAWPAVRAPYAGLVREWRTLRSALAVASPDVVHLHSAKAGLTARAAARGRVPMVYQPHAWSFLALEGLPRRLAASWERSAAKWVTTVVCCSEDERRRGDEARIRVPSVIVPNGVDLDRFRPAGDDEKRQLRARLGLDITQPLAVCAGRLSSQKGQDLLVAAWPQVRARLPDAVLVLVGDGPERGALEGMAGDGVRFVGGQSDVRNWLVAADVAVLPSRYEGMALGVLEAMACARSVVVSEADGMREAVGDGDTAAGAVVPIGDVAGIASAVTERLADRAMADREGGRGRIRVEGRHDQRAWAATLAEVVMTASGGP